MWYHVGSYFAFSWMPMLCPLSPRRRHSLPSIGQSARIEQRQSGTKHLQEGAGGDCTDGDWGRDSCHRKTASGVPLQCHRTSTVLNTPLRLGSKMPPTGQRRTAPEAEPTSRQTPVNLARTKREGASHEANGPETELATCYGFQPTMGPGG